MPIVEVDGVEYVERREPVSPGGCTPADTQALYLLLDQLRTSICEFRDRMERPRLQSDIDELDRMAGMANRAVGMLIGASR